MATNFSTTTDTDQVGAQSLTNKLIELAEQTLQPVQQLLQTLQPVQQSVMTLRLWQRQVQ